MFKPVHTNTKYTSRSNEHLQSNDLHKVNQDLEMNQKATHCSINSQQREQQHHKMKTENSF